MVPATGAARGSGTFLVGPCTNPHKRLPPRWRTVALTIGYAVVLVLIIFRADTKPHSAQARSNPRMPGGIADARGKLAKSRKPITVTKYKTSPSTVSPPEKKKKGKNEWQVLRAAFLVLRPCPASKKTDTQPLCSTVTYGDLRPFNTVTRSQQQPGEVVAGRNTGLDAILGPSVGGQLERYNVTRTTW